MKTARKASVSTQASMPAIMAIIRSSLLWRPRPLIPSPATGTQPQLVSDIFGKIRPVFGGVEGDDAESIVVLAPQ